MVPRPIRRRLIRLPCPVDVDVVVHARAVCPGCESGALAGVQVVHSSWLSGISIVRLDIDLETQLQLLVSHIQTEIGAVKVANKPEQ